MTPDRPNRNKQDDLTAVDNIRRIRERISAECGNDVRRICERATQQAMPLVAPLGMHMVKPPRPMTPTSKAS